MQSTRDHCPRSFLWFSSKPNHSNHPQRPMRDEWNWKMKKCEYQRNWFITFQALYVSCCNNGNIYWMFGLFRRDLFYAFQKEIISALHQLAKNPCDVIDSEARASTRTIFVLQNVLLGWAAKRARQWIDVIIDANAKSRNRENASHSAVRRRQSMSPSFLDNIIEWSHFN